MVLGVVDWTNVLIALIAAAPGIITAWYAKGIKRQIKTPSGGTLGEITEAAQQSAHANHALLKAINGDTIKRNYIADGITPADGTMTADGGKVGADEHG